MERDELQLVLGAGQVGPLVAERLRARGKRVRLARKSAGVDTVSLDARDPDQVARAADGASVVYHCINPLYHQWPEMLLPLVRGIVEGTARAGARLVVLDCLYMYGDTRHMTEESAVAPVSKKGALRAEMGALLLEADASGKLPVAIGRAADFFGPKAPNAVLGDALLKRALAGKSAPVFGDPDQIHSYAYIPDVAEGLVTLGEAKARGLWMLPVAPAETTRALVARFGAALGRNLALFRVPNWMLRAAGLFQPTLREAAEMTYQWEQPYVLDDTKFRNAFGVTATPLDRAVAETVAWARTAFAPEGAAALKAA